MPARAPRRASARRFWERLQDRVTWGSRARDQQICSQAFPCYQTYCCVEDNKMVKKSKTLVVQLKYPGSQSVDSSFVESLGIGSCISASMGTHTLHSSWMLDIGHGTVKREVTSIPPLPWACHDDVPQHKHLPPTLSTCREQGACHAPHHTSSTHMSHHTASTNTSCK